ncbi:MAG: hypothetical protein FWD21_04860, partial [Peptococcaceae bacterium]|nr:hypothetical protein [Peptococcaceae bacterium]
MNRLVFLLSIILVSTLLLTQTCPLPGAANVTTESMTLTDDDDANTNLLTLVSSSTPNGAR